MRLRNIGEKRENKYLFEIGDLSRGSESGIERKPEKRCINNDKMLIEKTEKKEEKKIYIYKKKNEINFIANNEIN